MEAGRRFYTATAFFTDRVYAHVSEHESLGSVAGVVAYRLCDGEVRTFPEADVYETREQAKAACVAKLRRRRDEVVRDIEAEIQVLEAQS